MPDDVPRAKPPLGRISRILQCYFGDDYGSLVRGSIKNGNSGRITPKVFATYLGQTFVGEVSRLLLRQIFYLPGPVLAADIRSLFNQFITDDRVKRNNRPICISAYDRPMPDIRRD